MLLEETATKIVAEGRDGWFGILPRHIDFVTALVPSVLVFVDRDGVERYLAVDEGILVKCAEEVQISVRNGVPGDDLHSLRDAVRAQFLELDERERAARTALARLEAGVVRRFIDLQGQV